MNVKTKMLISLLLSITISGCSNMSAQQNAVFIGSNAYILHQIIKNNQKYDQENCGVYKKC